MSDLRDRIKQNDPVQYVPELGDAEARVLARSILERAREPRPAPAPRRTRSLLVAGVGAAALVGGGVAVAGLLPADEVATAHLLAPPVVVSGVGSQGVVLPSPPADARYITYELACFDGTVCGTPAGHVRGADGEVKVDRGALPTTSYDDPANPQDLEPLTDRGLRVEVEEGTHWRLYAVFTDTYQPPAGTLPGGETLGLPGGDDASDYLPAVTADGRQGWVRYDDVITDADVQLTADGVRQAPVDVYAEDGVTVIGTWSPDVG